LPTLFNTGIVNKEDHKITPPSRIDVSVSPTSNMFLTLTGGYAKFNSNSGYHLSTGFLYDLNKIISVESTLAFSRGQDQTNITEDVFENENQIDLSLLLHLNLIRSKAHKLSFELGGGITRYWGTRIILTSPVTIDERSSFGRNLQGGLSYTYFLKRGHGIGLKFGVISYDDAVSYFAARYLYNF